MGHGEDTGEAAHSCEWDVSGSALRLELMRLYDVYIMDVYTHVCMHRTHMSECLNTILETLFDVMAQFQVSVRCLARHQNYSYREKIL